MLVYFLLNFASLFALSFWVGGGAAVSFVVAPVVFAKAPSRSVAGVIVGEVLQKFSKYSLVAAPVVLLIALFEKLATAGAERTQSLRLSLVIAMIALLLYSRFALSPEIEKLRPLPVEDPQRQAFGRLHGYSVLCLMGQIIFGAFAIGLSVMMLITSHSNGH